MYSEQGRVNFESRTINTLFRPYWQITATKSKNWNITQRHSRKQNPEKIENFYFGNVAGCYLRTKPRSIFGLDFGSINDARWRPQNKVFLDFVSPNATGWYPNFRILFACFANKGKDSLSGTKYWLSDFQSLPGPDPITPVLNSENSWIFKWWF